MARQRGGRGGGGGRRADRGGRPGGGARLAGTDRAEARPRQGRGAVEHDRPGFERGVSPDRRGDGRALPRGAIHGKQARGGAASDGLLSRGRGRARGLAGAAAFDRIDGETTHRHEPAGRGVEAGDEPEHRGADAGVDRGARAGRGGGHRRRDLLRRAVQKRRLLRSGEAEGAEAARGRLFPAVLRETSPQGPAARLARGGVRGAAGARRGARTAQDGGGARFWRRGLHRVEQGARRLSPARRVHVGRPPSGEAAFSPARAAGAGPLRSRAGTREADAPRFRRVRWREFASRGRGRNRARAGWPRRT